MSEFDILMVGNFAKDKLIVDGIETVASGGGVYYGSVVIRRLGLRVAVVTQLHQDDFLLLDEMKSEGVVVYATSADGTSGIANFYNSADMETRITKPIGFGGKYDLKQIPDLSAQVIMLSPLYAGEIDLSLLQALSQRAPLALDIQGFVRVPVDDDLIFRSWEEMEKGLKNITYLKLDKAEAKYLTGLSDIQEAAACLHAMGPKELVLTQTSGVTVFSDGKFYTAPFTSRSLVGRTGRGDTCFATYTAKRLTGSAEVACQWAAAVTSLKQEVPGPWKGTPAEIETILKKVL
jgi:sugar/nucleoside kinase (ribokinase family)